MQNTSNIGIAISVVMPVYNGEKYLSEAIESVLNQTFGDFEFIIINDGSTDRTEDIILSYADPRIVYVKNEENLQIARTLNKGIILVKGKYIARMDADDISLPERFGKQIAFMEANRDVDICGAWIQFFGHKDNVWQTEKNHESIKTELLFGCPMAHPTFMAKREVFQDHKYEDVYSEDYALWVMLIDKFQFANIQEVLLKYRAHSHQTTILHDDLQKENYIRIKTLVLRRLEMESGEAVLLDKISKNLEVLPKHVEDLLCEILLKNMTFNYFNQKVLEKKLFDYWWAQYRQKNISLPQLLSSSLCSSHVFVSKIWKKLGF